MIYVQSYHRQQIALTHGFNTLQKYLQQLFNAVVNKHAKIRQYNYFMHINVIRQIKDNDSYLHIYIMLPFAPYSESDCSR